MKKITTFTVLKGYFSKGTLPDIKPDAHWESKDEMKQNFRDEFEDLLTTDANPLLCFQLLSHRLGEIASIAKEVFYGPAVDYLKQQLEEDKQSGRFFNANVTLKTSEAYDVLKSPKILKLEQEIKTLEKKHEKTIKSYEKYTMDVKSITEQIKLEEKRLIEQGLAKKLDEKHTISLSY